MSWWIKADYANEDSLEWIFRQLEPHTWHRTKNPFQNFLPELAPDLPNNRLLFIVNIKCNGRGFEDDGDILVDWISYRWLDMPQNLQIHWFLVSKIAIK